MLAGQFGDAGKRLVIEQRISGPASLFALLDGENALMATAQDYKRANDNDQGPNTGGMRPFLHHPPDKTREDQIMAEIVYPVVRGMAAEPIVEFFMLVDANRRWHRLSNLTVALAIPKHRQFCPVSKPILLVL